MITAGYLIGIRNKTSTILPGSYARNFSCMKNTRSYFGWSILRPWFGFHSHRLRGKK